MFYKYFNNVYFFICDFILISTSQNLISFNIYFKYLLWVTPF